MRLGGPTIHRYSDPTEWVAELRRLGYGAAYCPVDASASEETIRAYARAAQEASIVIAEVGAWSNPLSRDEAERRRAVELCQRQLALAEAIDARCCVNISGSRGSKWDGPHPDNFSQETFDLVVETVRAILDAVQPWRTFYTLEPMPWAFPDSADSYLRLIRAIDHPQFAVHLDPVNMITSPRLYYNTGAFLRDLFQKLGPYIKSCHAKDITLGHTLTVHLSEVRPGLGELDYITFLHELDRLDADTPLMVEHLATADDYAQAASYIRSTAEQVGLSFVGPPWTRLVGNILPW